MTQQATFDTLSTALRYLSAGLSVLPIAPGSKRPNDELLPREWNEERQEALPTWKPYQKERARPHEVKRWFERGAAAGVGIIGGAVSGGLVVIDIESVEAYESWRQFAGDLAGPELIAALPVVATGKGRHVYVRMESPIGNRKLAMIGRTVIAETRGEGGYVLAPPSPHPSGATYTLLSGDLGTIPTVTSAQAAALFDAARALAPATPHPTSTLGGARDGGQGSVIDAFNAKHTISEVLESSGYTSAGPNRYVRPGGERGSVVIVGGRSCHYNTSDPLYSEAPAGGQHSHSAFSAWCQLKHSGDMKAAVRAAAAELGMRQDHATAPSPAGQVGTSGWGRGEEADTWPYFLHEGGMWMHRADKDGSPKLPLLLCNWTAQIEAEVTLNDGDNTEERYSITATCGRRSRRIEISRADFEGESAIGRIVAALGAKARINPAAQSKYIADAIKACSPSPAENTMYSHLGWVESRYLFANGYVDATGWHPATNDTASRAHLPDRLARYRLAPPTESGMADGIVLLDDLLQLAPESVMIPLIGAVLMAPIFPQLDTAAPMVHVYGPTGSHKTSIACCALALWGQFTPSHPTDTWTSTGNSVQRLGWHLMHAPMLLDDYKAANVKPNQVVFLLQNYGDNMARGRLDSNSEVRSAYPIRGVLISSGEDQPEGEASTLARILSVSLGRGQVHRGKLTQIQAQADYLHNLTIGYLQWIAGRADKDSLRQAHQNTRAAILSRLELTENATNPGRVASNVAALYVAWETFVTFLTQGGHWTGERAEGWLLTCKRELVGLAKRQLELTTSERYSQLFLETLRGLIASGKVRIQRSNSETPDSTGGTPIGYQAESGIFIVTGLAFDEVSRAARSAGRPVNYSLRALSQMLEQDGLLVSTAPPSLVVRRRFNGAVVWCWHLSSQAVE